MDKIKNYKYKPIGICAKEIIVSVDTEDNTIQSVSFMGGCGGNHKGIDMLVKGMKIDEVADKLSGVDCGGRGTSCPDQLSITLRKIAEVINKENKKDNV